MHLVQDVNPQITFVVGKAVIAIAWADGTIQPEEIVCIKTMLEEAPDIPKGRLEILNDLLQSPIQLTEREVIMNELAGLLHNREERNFAIYWLDQMLTSKGEPAPIEKEIHNQLIKRLMGETTKSLPPFSQAIRDRHPKDTQPHTPIDKKLQVWTDLVREHIPHLKCQDLQLKELIISGLLLSRVALADNRIDEVEATVIADYFIKHFSLSKSDAHDMVKELLAQEIEDEQDIILLSSELRKIATEATIEDLSETLFRVSTTPMGLKEEETNEIISITAALRLSEHHFVKNLRDYAGPIPK